MFFFRKKIDYCLNWDYKFKWLRIFLRFNLKYIWKIVARIARSAIFFSIYVELLISRLEFVRTVRCVNSSLVLIEILRRKNGEEKTGTYRKSRLLSLKFSSNESSLQGFIEYINFNLCIKQLKAQSSTNGSNIDRFLSTLSNLKGPLCVLIICDQLFTR